MAHEIIPDEPVSTKKKFNIQAPDLTGKFGLSLNIGKKEIFIGIAVAKIEIETIVRRKRQKVLKSPGRATFVPI